MTTKDMVLLILDEIPATRNSDQLLYWEVLNSAKLLKFESSYIREPKTAYITYELWMAAPPMESVTRARRSIQEEFPQYRATGGVKAGRKKKEVTKGRFIETEQV